MHAEHDGRPLHLAASPAQDAPGDVAGARDNARWVHDLRNAVNTASVASAVVRRMLDAGMADDALEMLFELERACMRCRTLLAERPGPAGRQR